MNYKLGDFIELIEKRNSGGGFRAESVRGISTDKKLIQTKAKLDGVKLTSYKLMTPKTFAFVADTSRRGDKMSLAYNDSDVTYLVSSISTVFHVSDNNSLNADYLYMYFNRPEFDRFARFNSWGSARETFSWDDMCDIEIDLPSLEIQEKYVAVYKAMLANQKSYENGLEDLKLVCDATIEKLRREIKCVAIGDYIEKINNKNTNKDITLVQGVEASGQFMNTKAKMSGIDISKYNIVEIDDIAYNPSRINIGSVAICKQTCVVSPMYEVFRVSETTKLLPQYLIMWLGRKETQRYTLFKAMGSVRDTFDFSLMEEYEIPVPSIELQKSIVDIYNAYITRRELNEKLKSLIKDICPILISGATKEAEKYGKV